jgi:hypothetical protein
MVASWGGLPRVTDLGSRVREAVPGLFYHESGRFRANHTNIRWQTRTKVIVPEKNRGAKILAEPSASRQRMTRHKLFCVDAAGSAQVRRKGREFRYRLGNIGHDLVCDGLDPASILRISQFGATLRNHVDLT